MVLINSFCHISHTPRRQAGDGVGGGECRGGGGGGGGANIKTSINTTNMWLSLETNCAVKRLITFFYSVSTD